MPAKTFDELYALAVERKGEDKLLAHLPVVESRAELAAKPDDRYLAAMTKVVFAAGFRWRVIEAKWAGFEEAFEGFVPVMVAAWGEAELDGLRQDRRIVRNPQNIRATFENARFVEAVRTEHGGFGRWLTAFGQDDVVAVWDALAERGARLGGNTGPRFLRAAGYDTFILTGDVTYALAEQGLMTAKPTTKTGRREAQRAFTAWREQSGRPLAHLSVVLACTVDRPPE